MQISFQIYDDDGWDELGTIELMPDGALERSSGLADSTAGTEPLFNPDPEVRRLVWPNEGALYLMTLVEFGGSATARFVLDSDEEAEP